MLLAAAFLFCLLSTARSAWWKGNTHTHTFWSDGDDFPEAVAEWYKTNGYHFLALSDHNTLHVAEKWISITNGKQREATLAKYVQRFGGAWVEQRTLGTTQQVRLKRFEEYRPLLEETNRFLLIPAEEISAKFRTQPLHINAFNLRDFIEPETGSNVT